MHTGFKILENESSLAKGSDTHSLVQPKEIHHPGQCELWTQFFFFFFFGAVVPNCDLTCLYFSVLRILQVWNADDRGFQNTCSVFWSKRFFSQFKITWLKVARLYQMSNNPIPKQSSLSWKQKFQSGVPVIMRDFTSIKLTRRD